MAAPEKIEPFDVEVADSSVLLVYDPPSSNSAIINYKLSYTNKTTGGKRTKIENTRIEKVSDLTNGHQYEFQISAENEGGYGDPSKPVTVTLKEKPKRKSQNSGITYAIALIIGVVDFAIINYFGLTDQQNPEFSIALVGIVTFFGVLVLSAHYNYANAEDQRKHATGTMRRAMAASIIMVYIITFSITTFGDFQDKTIEVSQTQLADEIKDKVEEALQDNQSTESITNIINATLTDKIPQLQGNLELELSSKSTLLGHFTTVTSLVIVFYFGSKALENWYGKKQDPLDKKLLKKSIDDAVEKIPEGEATEDAKKDLQDLSNMLK